MFYSQDILQKRGGKFGKIWLAATRMSKLTRREVASISVPRSCDAILAYVELRKARKLSLYLSALLMYGVVRIHQKHSEYLLSDVSSTFLHVNTLRKQFLSDIDLKEVPRAELVTNPDLDLDLDLDQMTEMEPQAPLRGLPISHDFWLSSNGSSNGAGSPLAKSVSVSADLQASPHTVASIDLITLKEPLHVLVDTPLSPIPVPHDIELPMMDGQEMNLLMMDQIDEPPLTVADLLPTSTPLNVDSDRTGRRRPASLQTFVESPTQVQQEEREKTPKRAPQPEVVPEPRAVPPSPGVTLAQVITSPLPRRQPRPSLELELTPMAPSPFRQRRRRQLAFADQETQIAKAQMKKNLTTGHETCEPFLLQDLHGTAANDFFNKPGRKELSHKPLLKLWTRNARYRTGILESQLAQAISPILPEQPSQPEAEQAMLDQQPGQEQPQEQVVPEVPEQPIEELQLSPVLTLSEERRKKRKRPESLEQSIEALRKISSMTEGPQIEGMDMPSMEMGRDGSTSRAGDLGMNLDDTLILDDSRQSKQDKTPSAKKRRTRSSVNVSIEEEPLQQDTASLISHSRSVSGARGLYDVMEESRVDEQYVAVPLFQERSALEQGVAEEELLSMIAQEIAHQDSRTTKFSKLCPHVMDRKSAARHFTALLELCAKKKVTAHQKSTFGDIYIRMN